MNCQLCNIEISNGLQLSNGEMIHDTCVDLIETKLKEYISRIRNIEYEIYQYQSELKKTDSLLYKFGAFINIYHIDTDKIRTNIKLQEDQIYSIKAYVVELKNRTEPIYDYYLSYPPDWDIRKEMVANRDGEACTTCRSTGSLHLHHKNPLSKGGNNKISNLKLLCRDCHSSEHGGRDFSETFSSNETAFSKRVSTLRYAIAQGKKVKFKYKKFTDDDYVERIVTPSNIINIAHRRDSGNTLCVKGFCELRNDDRTFALKRMKGLKIWDSL